MLLRPTLLLLPLLLASCVPLPSGTVELALGPVNVRVPVGPTPDPQPELAQVDAPTPAVAPAEGDGREPIWVREPRHEYRIRRQLSPNALAGAAAALAPECEELTLRIEDVERLGTRDLDRLVEVFVLELDREI
jgi:hypothetical protein